MDESMSTDDVIKIAVTIEVPCGAHLDNQAPRVSISAPMRPLTGDSISITSPQAYPGAYAHLKSSDDTICVAGTSSSPPDNVWVKLYPWPAYPPPSTPPGTAVPATINSDGSWILSSIGAAANTSYQVAAWGKWSGTYANDYYRIKTDAGGPYTDCTYPGSNLLMQRRAASMATFDLAPVAWQLRTTGFAGTGAIHFNGNWTLQLVKSQHQGVLYCNGGDAVSVPRIQLSCGSPVASTWELSFELSGKRVCYSRSTAQFDCQSGNSFQNALTVGLDDHAGIPAAVSVQPV
jgi:hypothetical protein